MYGGESPWESLPLSYRSAPWGNGEGRLGLISTKCGKGQENILNFFILASHPNAVQQSLRRSKASGVGERGEGEKVETWSPPRILPGDQHCCPDLNCNGQNICTLYLSWKCSEVGMQGGLPGKESVLQPYFSPKRQQRLWGYCHNCYNFESTESGREVSGVQP